MPNTIQRVSNISYAEFRRSHLLTNLPVLIGAELIDTWPCLQHWRVSDSSLASSLEPSTEQSEEKGPFSKYSRPNLVFLRARYGQHIVPVDEDGYRSEKALQEVIDIWERENRLSEAEKGPNLYVKDWHLALQLEPANGGLTQEDNAFYFTPRIFVDDWMNNYYRKYTNDDFRFVVRITLLPIRL